MPRLSLISFAVIPIMAVATILWRKRAREAYRLARRALAMVNADLQENINGVRVVQSFARERLTTSLRPRAERGTLDANMRSVRLSAIFFPGVDLLAMIAIGLVIWFGGTLVLQEQLKRGHAGRALPCTLATFSGRSATSPRDTTSFNRQWPPASASLTSWTPSRRWPTARRHRAARDRGARTV